MSMPPTGHLPRGDLKRRLLDWSRLTGRYPLYKGSASKLGAWFMTVEQACRAIHIPRTQFTEAAVLLIANEQLAEVMEERQRVYLEANDETYWEWVPFKQDIRNVVSEYNKSTVKNWIIAAAGVSLLGAGLTVLVPAIPVALLNILGFTQAGVSLGSIAAAIQSVFYGGATGGIFSVLQSLGATWALPALGSVIAATVASGVGKNALSYAIEEIRNNSYGRGLPPPPSPPS